jgi:sugar phosphate isomerase/epimerase
MYTRRELGRFAAATWGATTLSRAAFAAVSEPADGVHLGATTWSLRDLPRISGQDNVADLIGPLKSAGVTAIDLWSYNTEPAGPNTGPGAPPPPAAYPIKIKMFTPEEIAEAMLAARNLTRDWRLSTPADRYAEIRAKFAAAGISVTSYTVHYDATFTDQEIDVTFRQAKALGAAFINAPGVPEAAQRLAPFAERHRVNVALADFTLASSLPSKLFSVNADIGAITAANGSPVAYIQENHDVIAQLTIKDRRLHKGKNEQFGDGDTPVRDVLRLVKEKKYTFPVFAEYEYLGLGTPAEELARCMDYMRAALA